MSRQIQCFWIERTALAEVRLRRYADSACPLPRGYHDASVSIEREAYPLDIGHEGDGRDGRREVPRWPTACACGYIFKDSDQWQCHRARLLKRADTGELM